MQDYTEITETTPLLICTRINQRVAHQIINQWAMTGNGESIIDMTILSIGHRNSRTRLNAYVDQHVKGKVCYNYGEIGFEDPKEATEFQLRYIHEW